MLAVGGPNEVAGLVGATWLFQFNGSRYNQVGSNLVGPGYKGYPRQGKQEKDMLVQTSHEFPTA